VLLGDLVNRGCSHEYERARQLLADFDGKIEPLVGNHELQRGSLADFDRSWCTDCTRVVHWRGLTLLMLNSGLENLPDTQWHGALSEPQLHLLRGAVSLWGNRPLLVFCHHPIKGTVAVSSQPMFALDNSAEVDRILTGHPGPVVFISGHTHTASVVRRGPITYLGCPALGFWPHAFLVLDIDENRLEFSTVAVCPDPSNSPDAGASDPGYRAQREGQPADRSGTIPLR
jgi:3',5'-cyclic AMP phosphodiesterase CpdA